MRLFHVFLILIFGHALDAASVFQFPDLIRRMPERPTPGCAYKGDRIAHGDQVETTEPCLNCTCIQAVVVCYLRVCPSASAPPPGCFLAREPGQCCPTLLCGGENKPKPYESDDPSAVEDLRPTFQPKPTETEETTPIITTTGENSLVFVSSAKPDDEDISFLNDIPGGCLVNGTLYGDGSAMLSSSFCEYCFCIRGKSTCLKPKCDLVIEGCTPYYDSNFACCPSRYDCYRKSPEKGTTVAIETTSVTRMTSTAFLSGFGDCKYGKTVYRQGEVIPGYRSCHNCYCNDSVVLCHKIKCSPPIAGCQPVIPEGHCCPVSYKCDYQGNSGNNNVKGANSTVSNSGIEVKRTEIKTMKQSEAFKDISNSNIGEKSKNPAIVNELSSFFHNFVPIHRRLDEDVYELYISDKDDTNSSKIILGQYSDSHTNNSKIHKSRGRENDKTLNLEMLGAEDNTTNLEMLDAEDHTTNPVFGDETEITTKYTGFLSANKRNETESSQTVSVGPPEVQTITMQELFDQFFGYNLSNYSKLANEDNLEPKRNNSKQPSSIVDVPDLETTRPYLSDSNGTDSTENPTTEVDEYSAYTSTLTSQENNTYTTPAANGAASSIATSKTLNPALIYTTLHFLEDDASSDSPHIIKASPDTRTDSTLPTKISTVSGPTTVTEPTELPSQSTTKDDRNAVRKQPIRINSKLPSSSYSDTDPKDSGFSSRDPLLQESLVKMYLPAEGRADTSDDFMNVGAIHLGAPLSVDAIEPRKDPTSLKDKITESGGVIFMDPKYTDINPKTGNQPKPTETNAMKDASSRHPTPIERSDIDYTNYNRKKGSRIQDGYNQTSNPEFKIIPFVAEDAIRGISGKGNNTFLIHSGTTQGIPDMVSDFCFIKGRIYMNGEMIAKSDPCELCRCFYGQELCQLQRCPTPPAGCTAEKIKAFCCPRYTCGSNSSSKEQFPHGQKITIDTPSKDQTIRPTTSHEITEKPKQEEIKFGIRVRPRPMPIFIPKHTTAKLETTEMPIQLSTLRKPDLVQTPATQISKSSMPTTTKIPEPLGQLSSSNEQAYNRTTRQPEISSTTKKPSSNSFSDPWGLLKVSGCNIYGKFFNINDQVEVLSGPCSHCICTTNGVECNDIC